MDNFFAYLQRLELTAFFSGYPLVYTVIIFFATNQKNDNIIWRSASLLPFAYALTGSLYLGFQLKNLYPEYSIARIKLAIHQPILMGWAVCTLVFWIPALAKKGAWSLLHSLVFFFLIVKDLLLQITTSAISADMVTNDMKTFAFSLMLNTGTFVFIALFGSILQRYRAHIK